MYLFHHFHQASTIARFFAEITVEQSASVMNAMVELTEVTLAVEFMALMERNMDADILILMDLANMQNITDEMASGTLVEIITATTDVAVQAQFVSSLSVTAQVRPPST